MPPETAIVRALNALISGARAKFMDIAIALVGIALAVVLRLSLLEFKSIDYFNYTKVWFNALQTGGFSAFSQSFSNYNLPYLYLLYLVIRFLPNLPGLVATKLPSLVADFVSAWIGYRMVRLRYPGSPVPTFAFLALLLAPTVVLNSAFWGQADAIYTCAAVAGLYFVLQRQDAPAMLLLGVALAFKAQAIFLFPLLLGLLIRREIGWKYVLLIPLVMLAALVPALIAGRPLLDLLLIYPSQAGQYDQLTMHAPSALSWVPGSGSIFPYFYPAGLIVAAAVSLGYAFVISRATAKLTPPLILELALLSVLIVPFFLPKMHERYFYMADVLSIVFAFYVPGYFFVPLLMSTISFFSYQPTLFGVEPVPISLLALGVFILIIILSRHALLRLFPDLSKDQEVAAAVQ